MSAHSKNPSYNQNKDYGRKRDSHTNEYIINELQKIKEEN